MTEVVLQCLSWGSVFGNLSPSAHVSFYHPVHVCVHRGAGETWPGLQGARLVEEPVTAHSCARLRAHAAEDEF